MRDIGPVLRERLATIARERARLNEMEAGIKALLKLEGGEDFKSSTNGDGDHAGEPSNTPLAKFLLDTLKQAKRSLTVTDLKAAAKNAGLDFGEKSPGRVLHWALVGKMRSGVVEKVGGKWRLVEEDK
jgi:hypothetical protein